MGIETTTHLKGKQELTKGHHYGHLSIDENGEYHASLDKDNNSDGVAIPKAYGEMMHLAFRLEDKVNYENRPYLKGLLSLLNCRKSAFAVAGTMSSKEVINKDTDDINAVEVMMSDVERIQSIGNSPVIGTIEELGIESFLEDHEDQLPVVVHMFGVKEDREANVTMQLVSGKSLQIEEFERMHRYHTFLVLGKDKAGRYVCFEKSGPTIDYSFAILSLQDVIQYSHHPSKDSTLTLSVIGPVKSNQ